jgi:hypothetical protein
MRTSAWMALLRRDRPRRIDRLIDYFGEARISCPAAAREFTRV